MSRACPNCSVSMNSEVAAGVSIDECPECRGLWFDADELKRVMLTDPVSLAGLEEETATFVPQHYPEGSTRRCPVCERVLDRFQYEYDSPIQLDACGTCNGIWVDSGELKRMSDWLDSHSGAAPRNSEAIEAEKQMAVAEFTAQHEQTMARITAVQGLCTMLGRWPQPWRQRWRYW